MTIGERIKKAIGIEGSTSQALLPMISYNALSISTAGSSYLISLYYLAFLTYVEGLSPGQAGTVLLFKSLWDAAIDPFIGIATDRTRSRMGRHRIYVLLAAVPFGVTYFLLWNSFGISGAGSNSTVMLYYIFANLLFTTAQSLVYVPHNAMLPELAPKYFQRTQFISVGYLFNSTGMFPSFLLASAFLGMVKTEEFSPGLRPVFLKMGLLLGVIYILPILATAIFTKEKSSKDMEIPPFNGKYVLDEYKMVFKNKAFLQYFGMSVLLLFGSALFANSKTYFIYELADAKQYLNMLVFWAGIAEMSAFIPNYFLTKKFGKAKMAWFTVPFLLISLGLSFVIDKQSPGAQIPWMLVALFAQEMLYPFGYSGIGFAINNILPDVTDVDEMITGRRREGVISTFSAFVKTATGGVLQFLVGIILEWFGVQVKDSNGNVSKMFNARASNLFGERLGGPKAGLRLVHGGLPIIFVVLALLALRRYTMTREEHKRIREVIALKHAEQKGEDAPEDVAPPTEDEKKRLSELAGVKWDEMWAGS